MPGLGFNDILLIAIYWLAMFGAPVFLIWRFIRAMQRRNRIAEQMATLLADAEGLRTEARLIAQELAALDAGVPRR